MSIKEDDIVMCTIKNIEGASVFLHIEGDGEGSMVMSEVAAGRIRNIREYIAPNKKVVCKVLKIINGHVQLSLRRVTAKEREEVQERYKKENILTSLLKTATKNPQQVSDSIKQNMPLWEFYDNTKENPTLAEKYMNADEAKTLTRLLEDKREKDKIVKKEIVLKTTNEEGIKDMKEILNSPDLEIHYLGSSRFSLTAIAPDFKDANHKMQSALERIERLSKEKKAILEIKEK